MRFPVDVIPEKRTDVFRLFLQHCVFGLAAERRAAGVIVPLMVFTTASRDDALTDAVTPQL